MDIHIPYPPVSPYIWPVPGCLPHDQVLDFLTMHRSEGGTTEAIDAAAANGHLDVVRWLTVNKPELPATTRAMDDAACEGNLAVVQYLHENRREGCTTEAMDSAARRGHLEVRMYQLVSRHYS